MEEITDTQEGVTKRLKKVNPGRICGSGMIPARILKDLTAEIAALPFFEDPLTAEEYQMTGDLQT